MENQLFEFDEQIHEVSFPATTRKGGTRTVSHRLRSPTLDELHKRENLIKTETEKVNSRATGVRTYQNPADIWLWDQIAEAVRGYENSDEWQELTDEMKRILNPAHKADAIAFMYAARSVIEGEGDYVPLGPTDWTVRQEIGWAKEPDYIIYHILREPDEDERAKYDRAKSTTMLITGARTEQGQVQTHLKPNIALYDALIQDIRGATVAGETFSSSNRREFLAAIDPLWKRNVIQTLMGSFEAQISD